MLQHHVVVDKNHKATKMMWDRHIQSGKKLAQVDWPSWGCALALRIPTETSHCGCCLKQFHIRKSPYLKQMVWMNCNVRSSRPRGLPSTEDILLREISIPATLNVVCMVQSDVERWPSSAPPELQSPYAIDNNGRCGFLCGNGCALQAKENPLDVIPLICFSSAYVVVPDVVNSRRQTSVETWPYRILSGRSRA